MRTAQAPTRALPSINKVQEVVARRWGVTPEGLRSKARIKTLTVPRQIAMYLARELLGMQLVEIGQAFGGRDHSTVIHSVDKVSRQMSRDRDLPRAGRARSAGVVRRIIPACRGRGVGDLESRGQQNRVWQSPRAHTHVDTVTNGVSAMRYEGYGLVLHISRASTTATSIF